jgi:lysophospholipase L1-like esterase
MPKARPARVLRVAAPKAAALRALSLLFGLALSSLVLEIGLRVLGYAGAGDREKHVFDPKYGTVNADSWIFGFAIDQARHRAVDIRGQLVPLHKDKGETRVLFLGDSATEGAFVSLEQSYPLRLKALLDARDASNHVRVINAGVWGMTTIDEYHLLNDKLLPLRPDLVVIGLFMANDLNFNLGHGQKHQHYLAPGWLDVARQHSALVHFLFLRALALNQRYKLVRSDRLGSTWVASRVGLIDSYGLHMLSYPAGEIALYMRRPSKLADEAFLVLEDVLSQLLTLGAQRGFAVRVLLIPTPSAVAGRLTILHYPDILRELRTQGVVVREDDLDFTLPTRRVLAICDRLHVRCIDPSTRFRQLGPSAFFPTDEHPSVAGHDALARALLEQRPE